MNLLILTQKIDKNDDVLGFFHGWVVEFAKHCEKVTVICLQKGEYDLPNNVRIFSLGKEKLVTGHWSLVTGVRLRYTLQFYRLIFRERKNYDTVFVHMNPEYVVFGGVLWRLWKKKIVLWYTHKSVDLKLRIAEKFANVIFTSAKESFRLASKKVIVLGHGIDVRKFQISNFKFQKNKFIHLVSVGRITPIKNLDVLVEACAILKTRGVNFHAKIIGAPAVASDSEYLDKLKKLVAEKKLEGEVEFVGSVPNNGVARYYWESDFEVNLCPTGGIDKAVLEAMAAGAIPLVSNKAFAEYFKEYKEDLLFKERDAEDLVEKIAALANLPPDKKDEIREYLQEKAKEFETAKLIEKIVSWMT